MREKLTHSKERISQKLREILGVNMIHGQTRGSELQETCLRHFPNWIERDRISPRHYWCLLAVVVSLVDGHYTKYHRTSGYPTRHYIYYIWLEGSTWTILQEFSLRLSWVILWNLSSNLMGLDLLAPCGKGGTDTVECKCIGVMCS